MKIDGKNMGSTPLPNPTLRGVNPNKVKRREDSMVLEREMHPSWVQLMREKDVEIMERTQ
tara:strand:+ start:200 stop:379 length:180 start_codon:yes stop_codon:yes gene_type:complete